MKSILLIILTLSFNSIYSQGLEITYIKNFNIEKQLSEIKDSKEKEIVKQQLSIPTNFSLFYNNGTSLFKIKNIENDNFEYSDKYNRYQNVEITDNDIIFKDLINKSFIMESDLLGKKFLITDKLTPIKWELSNESKKINNFFCKKATATIQNEKIEAWYTTDIPINDGPGEFWGLPGLIVFLTTEYINYTINEIKPINTSYSINVPTKGKPITKEKFEITRDQFFSELEENVYE